MHVARNSICAPPFCLRVQFRVVRRQDLPRFSRLQETNFLFLNVLRHLFNNLRHLHTTASLPIATRSRHRGRCVAGAGVGDAYHQRSAPFPRGPALYIFFPAQRARIASADRLEMVTRTPSCSACRARWNYHGRPGHGQLLSTLLTAVYAAVLVSSRVNADY